MNVFVRVLQKVAEIRVIIYKIYSIFMDFMYKKIIHYIENKNPL